MRDHFWTRCESERWSRLRTLIAWRAPVAFAFLAALAAFAKGPITFG